MITDDLSVLDKVTLSDLEKTLDRHTRKRVPPTKWTAFSWSYSRYQMFERCKRQYYLNYYGSRDVRKANDALVTAVWWLKQVTSLKAWVGTVVHLAAAHAVKAYIEDETLSADALIDFALKTFDSGIQASTRGSKTRTAGWVLLYEHLPYSDEQIPTKATKSRITQLIETFIKSEAYRFITSLDPLRIYEVDESFQSFAYNADTIGEIQVFAIPDVLVKDDSEHITIIDWKTGDITREDLRVQAGMYQYYAHERYFVPEDDITVFFSNLGGSGENVQAAGQSITLIEMDALMRESISSMVTLLDSTYHNSVRIENFPMTDDLAVCKSCGFNRACWRHEVDI